EDNRHRAGGPRFPVENCFSSDPRDTSGCPTLRVFAKGGIRGCVSEILTSSEPCVHKARVRAFIVSLTLRSLRRVGFDDLSFCFLRSASGSAHACGSKELFFFSFNAAINRRSSASSLPTRRVSGHLLSVVPQHVAKGAFDTAVGGSAAKRSDITKEIQRFAL